MWGKLLAVTLLAAVVLPMAGCKRSVSESTQAVPQDPATLEAKMVIPTLDDTTLSQYKGKIVLVNFWATWCEPCKKEIPWLIKLNDEYKSRGLVILGVSMDDDGRKSVAPFVVEKHFAVDGRTETMNYPILLGNDAISDKFGGLMGLPTSMLYGRDGNKVKTIVGAVDSYQELSQAVDKQL